MFPFSSLVRLPRHESVPAEICSPSHCRNWHPWTSKYQYDPSRPISLENLRMLRSWKLERLSLRGLFTVLTDTCNLETRYIEHQDDPAGLSRIKTRWLTGVGSCHHASKDPSSCGPLWSWPFGFSWCFPSHWWKFLLLSGWIASRNIWNFPFGPFRPQIGSTAFPPHVLPPEGYRTTDRRHVSSTLSQCPGIWLFHLYWVFSVWILSDTKDHHSRSCSLLTGHLRSLPFSCFRHSKFLRCFRHWKGCVPSA